MTNLNDRNTPNGHDINLTNTAGSSTQEFIDRYTNSIRGVSLEGQLQRDLMMLRIIH